MSAERLREAARLMRERAGVWGAARPWACHNGGGSYVWAYYPMGPVDIASEADPKWAPHIASWHPVVALAVADLLDHAAEACDLNRSPYVEDQHRLAHAAADAYLGATP